MVKWIFGIAELIVSITSMMGLSIVSHSPGNFLIEQFIIIFPHILNYACSTVSAQKYITKHEVYEFISVIVGIAAAALLFISLFGLFISISKNIQYSGTRMIWNMSMYYPGNIHIKFLKIIFIDSLLMCGIDAYSIKTENVSEDKHINEVMSKNVKD